MTITPILVDRTNWELFKPKLFGSMEKATLVGLDIETEDSEAHAGIKKYRGANTARVFDINRTKLCGLSLYFDGEDIAYYFNIGHADVANQLPWLWLKELLDTKPETASLICHNAPFELTMLFKTVGYQLDSGVICTLQMCVSAYGPDEYDPQVLFNTGIEEMATLWPDVEQAFADYDGGPELTSEQSEILGKVIAKESEAAHSYNGFVDKIAYGYSLKKAVKSHFNFKMTTFDEALQGRDHMGQLTGAEVVAYGADDAYWCVRLFRHILRYMSRVNPSAIDAFFNQENPMIFVYADLWKAGMRINTENVVKRRNAEREICADVLRELKAVVRQFLPFPEARHELLAERDKWYAKNWKGYRNRIEAWAKLPDSENSYEQCKQISGSVSTAWASEMEGIEKLPGPNFTHYMMMRTLIYDLIEEKPIVMMGKTQSDGDCRGYLHQRFDKRIKALKEQLETMPGPATGENAAAACSDVELDIELQLIRKNLIGCISALASIEQRMKLYLNTYVLLKDPETGRMYPVVSSMLASRRLGATTPNPMQLSKQGESTYIRGFFLPDYDDHVIVSIDWKQVELVLIGEFSGDPEFAKAYGQLPYQDLHLGAAADILSAIYSVDVTEEMFKSLKSMPDDVREPFGFPLVDHTGKVLTPKEAYKWNRGTAGGKGANFGYWYSGSLASVATARGVGPDLMWKMTDKYRNRFPVAEQWRLETIANAANTGFVQLPDGHTRVRFESTPEWAHAMRQKFAMYGSDAIKAFGELIIKKVQRRSANQIVNSKIQGSCATLAKRSIIKINQEIRGCGFNAARFMLPIHDELLYSVHHREAWDFTQMTKRVMTNHPEIISKLKMDCSAAIGRNFEPWHPKKAPYGQIEIDEAPALSYLPPETEGKALDRDQVELVIKGLFQ